MDIEAVCFDFADTLYPHRPREMSRILAAAIEYLRDRIPPFPQAEFESTFLQIRDRQFSENRALLRENDFAARWSESIQHVNRGFVPDAALVANCLHAYADAFVDVMVMPDYLPDLFHRLSHDYRLCVISNYPLTPPITRTLERDGLLRHLDGVVVSADHGVIKPHSALFEAARTFLGSPRPDRIIHIGDDWDADIVGAGRAGFRSIYTREWRDIPDVNYGSSVHRPVAEVDDLRKLPELLDALRKGDMP